MNTAKDNNEIKNRHTDFPISDMISQRWSPYVFDNRAVDPDDFRSLFEAARWAASSFNDQPWYYIVATRDQNEEYEKLLSCLVEPNQAWAKDAPVLALGVIRTKFIHNDSIYYHALHDLGQASATLTFEATSRGISVHQMAGIIPDKAREIYGVPDGYEIVTGIAIGYHATKESNPDGYWERDESQSKRFRRKLNETIFGGTWDKAHTLFDGK
jgi:nitroreductase